MTNAKGGDRFSHCSVCGKPQPRSKLIVAGRGQVAVCYDCIQVLGELITTEAPAPSPQPKPSVPLVPRAICSHLDEYVIGQERAKKVLSVAVYNHFKRIGNGAQNSAVELQKANILLIGPTGCGKTMLAETLARTLEVPIAVCDATSLTESGYVGEDVENILLRLIQAAEWDIARAKQGIIYIDELDKIARKEGVNRSISRDVSGEGVQQEFLQINTKNILFICGGTFDGLTDIISRRITYSGSQMGFLSGGRYKPDAGDANVLNFVTPEDLLQFGFIPEMVGRLPVVASLEELDRDALVRVLVEPKNAIVKQYQQLFNYDGVELMFTQGGPWKPLRKRPYPTTRPAPDASATWSKRRSWT